MFIIDTLEFSKSLEKAGMQKNIAETLAEKIKESQLKSDEVLATKKDIEDLRIATKSDTESLRQEIKISMLTTIISLGTIVTLLEKFLK